MLLNRLILPIFLLGGVSFGQGYGSIEGTVTDEGGMVISGATVYAFSIEPRMTTAIPTAETDAEGHYIFKRLDYGRYSVAPAKPADGYAFPLHTPNCAHVKYPEIELSAENQSAKLDLRFGKKAGVLVGTVTDADNGNPVEANVEFRCTVLAPGETLTLDIRLKKSSAEP